MNNTSIDDLLNSTDSDDDIDNNDIDLEEILKSNDDLDDFVSNGIDEVKVENSDNEKYKKNISEITVESLHILRAESRLDIAKVLEVNQEVGYCEISDDLSEDDRTSFYSSLLSAENREQQFLSSGNRDVVSALQSKRKKQFLGSYSNIRTDVMSVINGQLKQNADCEKHGPGSASAIIVHKSFIAIGTTRGLIIIFDHNQEIRQVVGSNVQPNARSTATVTAIDINITGTNMICGYSTGEVALWNIPKGVLLKRVNDVHLTNVLKIQFISNIGETISSLSAQPQATLNENNNPPFFATVSYDAKGVMHKTRFVKGAIWSSSYACESECLLDGSAGPVNELSALLPYSENLVSTSIITGSNQQLNIEQLSFVRGNTNSQLMAFTFVTQTCLVQVAPVVRIIYKWPTGIRIKNKQNPTDSNSSVTPVSIDWTWGYYDSTAAVGDDEKVALSPHLATTFNLWRNDVFPMLARCCKSNVEILAVRMENNQPSRVETNNGANEKFQIDLLFKKSIPDLEFVALRWITSNKLLLLSQSSVVVMDHYLITTDQSALDPFISINLKDQSIPFTVCCSENKLYFFAKESLFKLQLQSCFELANKLIHDGQWLEALALVLENVSKNQSLLQTDKNTVDRYITKYVDLAAKQPAIKSSFHRENSSSSKLNNNQYQQQKNHHHLVAGVCIEYCISTKRFDLLFKELYNIFIISKQKNVFLDSIEPFILTRSITSLPIHILTDFFQEAIKSNRVTMIERCVAYLDVKNIDLNFLTCFLFENRIYSGFIYIHGKGFGDACLTFQIIFDQMVFVEEIKRKIKLDKKGFSKQINDEKTESIKVFPSSDQVEIGYKVLLYLKYTFNGKIFPRGDAVKFKNINEIYQLLLQVTNSEFPIEYPPSPFNLWSKEFLQKFEFNYKKKLFPYLHYLSLIDSSALIQVLFEGLNAVVVEQALYLNKNSADNIKKSSSVDNTYNAALNVKQIDTSSIIEKLFYFSRLNSSETHVDPVSEFENNLQEKQHDFEELFFCSFIELIVQSATPFSLELLEGLVKYANKYSKANSSYKDSTEEAKSISNFNYNKSRREFELLMIQLVEKQTKYPKILTNFKKFLTEKNFWLAALSVKSFFTNTSASATTAHDNQVVDDFDKALQFYASLSQQISLAKTENESKVDLVDGLGTSKLLTNQDIANFNTILSNNFDNQKMLNVDTDLNNSKLLFLDEELIFEYIETQFQQLSVTSIHFADSNVSINNSNNAFVSKVAKLLCVLFTIHPSKTKDLVCKFLSNYVSDIIINTNNDLKVQFELLHAIASRLLIGTRDELNSRSIKDVFTTRQIVVHYIRLLAAFEPGSVFTFLKNNEEFCPIDDCLIICREKGISDAIALLLERSGDVNGAITVLLKDFSNKIKFSKREIDAQIRIDATNNTLNSSSTSLISQILSKQGSARMEFTLKLPVYKVLVNIVNCAADLCTNHATAANSSSMWFNIFDHLLNERQTIRSGIVSSSGEIVIVLIGLLIQALMTKMKRASSTITSQDIIRRITQQGNAAGIKLNEFKDVMLSMLESNVYELFLNSTVNKIIHKDVTRLHLEKINKARRACYRSDGIDASEKNYLLEDTMASKSEEQNIENDVEKSKKISKATILHRQQKSLQRCSDYHDALNNVVQDKDFSVLLNTSIPVFVGFLSTNISNSSNNNLNFDERKLPTKPQSFR